MRLSYGMATFLVGLVLLAIAGLLYQQWLIGHGAASTAAPASASSTPTGSPAAAPAARPAVQLYTCPMHPQIIRDHPGTCPICGMELVPKTNDTGQTSASLAETVRNVKLSPTQAVLADVQPVHPTRERMALTIPAIGEVQVPDDRMNMLVSWQEGRVDNLVLRESGGTVKKGDHILDIYSEDLVQAQDEYLLALDAVQKLGQSGFESISSGTKDLLEASRKKLLRLGLTAEQLTQLEKTHQAQEHVPIYATHGGTVMEKKVTEGMYVMRGEELFSVADLSKVWVIVKVFEKDAANLRAGDHVTMKCPIHPGMIFHGRVELIEPELDMATRTHRARVIVDNAAGILKPGLALDAELAVDYGSLLLLPRNAVLHTGDGDLVYVLAGENLWEPRRVQVGRDFGDKVEIVSGLKRDEAVAGTAVFLLDSEAQLKGVPRPTDEAGAPAPAPPASREEHRH